MVKKLLFLLNVDSTFSIPDKSYRFPFDEYKKTTWSIEHIYAQNSENILEKDYTTWLTDNLISLKEHYNSIETKPLILKIEEILKKYQSDSKFSDFITREEPKKIYLLATLFILQKSQKSLNLSL